MISGIFVFILGFLSIIGALILGFVFIDVVKEYSFNFEEFKNTTYEKNIFITIACVLAFMTIVLSFFALKAIIFDCSDIKKSYTNIEENKIEFYTDFKVNEEIGKNKLYSILYEGYKTNYIDYNMYKLVLKDEDGSPYNRIEVANSVQVNYYNIEQPLFIEKTYEKKSWLFYKKTVFKEIALPLEYQN